MPKYLVTGSYTAEGAKGVVAKGGSDRRAAVEKLTESVGGASARAVAELRSRNGAPAASSIRRRV